MNKYYFSQFPFPKNFWPLIATDLLNPVCHTFQSNNCTICQALDNQMIMENAGFSSVIKCITFHSIGYTGYSDLFHKFGSEHTTKLLPMSI